MRDIYARKAECRSDETVVKCYIPPQFYARFSALNMLCKEKREKDRTLKTQLRFGERDLEVLTKEKGGEEPFRVVNMKEFTKGREIPDFDHTIRWKVQPDRPPRRRVMSSSGEEEMETGRDRGSEPARRKDRRTPQNKWVRQHSTGEDTIESKKRRMETETQAGEQPVNSDDPSGGQHDETL